MGHNGSPTSERTSDLLAVLHSLSGAVNQAPASCDAMQLALAELCAIGGWPYAQVWTVAPGDDMLTLAPVSFQRSTRLVGLEIGDRDRDLERVTDESAQLTFARGEGLVGRAWQEQVAVVASADHAHGAAGVPGPVARAGLHFGVAIPVKHLDDVLAVIGMFSPAPVVLDEQFLATIVTVATHVGAVIARDRATRRLATVEQALQLADDRLERAFDDALIGMAIVGPDSRFRRVNPVFCSMLGRSEEELLDLSTGDVLHRDDQPFEAMARERMGDRDRERQTLNAELRFVRSDDTTIWGRLYAVPLFDPAGELQGFFGQIEDVTDRHRVESLLAGQSGILEQIACRSPIEVILGSIVAMVEDRAAGTACFLHLVDDRAGTLRIAAAPSLPDPSRAAVAMADVAPSGSPWGRAAYERSSVVVTDLARSPAHAVLPAVVGELVDAGYRGCWAAPVQSKRLDAVLGTLTLLLRERRDPTGQERELIDLAAHLAAIAVERDRADAELARRALHDPLTDLPNRRLLLDRLTQAMATDRRAGTGTGVLFLDLDNFKLINDSMGHTAGDSLLMQVSMRLRAQVREVDTVARFGGDEFVVVCQGVHQQAEVVALAERMLAAVSEPLDLDGNDVVVTASAGVAWSSGGDTKPEMLLGNADAAMYRAKARGRDCVEVFEPNIASAVVERLGTVRALRRAVDHDEFRLVYQPLVSLAERDIVGVEALLRWDRPERGEVPPCDFIPLAEDSGLIVRIGSWVLEAACRQAAVWQRQRPGRDLIMNVNVSGHQLRGSALVEELSRITEVATLRPGLLCLEITESVLMDDPDVVAETLAEIKRRGFRIAIDDFGTGHSSLGRLASFPVDQVKIDRAFVSGLGAEAHSSAIVGAIVSVARAFGADVVAEGVETMEQLRELHALGCDVAQGYLFARPLPASSVGAMLDLPGGALSLGGS